MFTTTSATQRHIRGKATIYSYFLGIDSKTKLDQQLKQLNQHTGVSLNAIW